MEGLHIIGFQSNILPNFSKYFSIYIYPTFSVIFVFSSDLTALSSRVFSIDWNVVNGSDGGDGDDDGDGGSRGSTCAYIILFCIIKSFVKKENENTVSGINININFIL